MNLTVIILIEMVRWMTTLSLFQLGCCILLLVEGSPAYTATVHALNAERQKAQGL